MTVQLKCAASGPAQSLLHGSSALVALIGLGSLGYSHRFWRHRAWRGLMPLWQWSSTVQKNSQEGTLCIDASWHSRGDDARPTVMENPEGSQLNPWLVESVGSPCWARCIPAVPVIPIYLAAERWQEQITKFVRLSVGRCHT